MDNSTIDLPFLALKDHAGEHDSECEAASKVDITLRVMPTRTKHQSPAFDVDRRVGTEHWPLNGQ